MTVTITKPAINIREKLTEASAQTTGNSATVTGGTGVTVSSGVVSIGQAVGTTDSVTFGQVNITSSLPSMRLYDSDTNSYSEILNNNQTLSLRADENNVGSGSYMDFRIDGTERMRINSSGNVGIGTSSPATKLDVEGEIRSVGVNLAQGISQGNAGAVDARFAFNQDGTQIGWIGAPNWNSNSLFIYGPTASNSIEPVLKYNASKLELRTSNINRLVIDSSGNVGVGTTTPNFSLDVEGASNSTYLRVGGDDTSNDRGLQFTSSASASFNGAVHTINAPSSQGEIAFATSSTEALRIDSSGNVGIGNATPGKTLDVNGEIRQQFDDTSNLWSDINGGANAYTPMGPELVVENGGGSGVTNSMAGLFLRAGSTSGAQINAARIAAIRESAINTAIGFATRSSSTGMAERMRIDSSGNVGIGITSSISSKLHVADSIRVARSSFAPAIYFENSSYTGGDASIRMFDSGHVLFSTDNTERMRITDDGEVRIAGTTDRGAYNLQVNGTGVWGQGAYFNGSDERMKEEIADLNDGLEVINQLRPVTYRYREEFSKDRNTQAGFIAQELKQALSGKNYAEGTVPEGPEYLSVAYQNLIPVLTAAIQEQQTQIEALEARLAVLEATP